MPLIALWAFLATAATIAAFFGRWSPLLDLVANFRPHLAVLTLFPALVAGGRRWTKTALLAGAGTVVNVVVLAPLFIPPRLAAPLPQTVTEPFSVLTFNLLSTNANYEEVIEFIREEAPDLILLHEVSQPWEDALAQADLDYEITRGRTDSLIFGSLVLAPPEAEVRSYGFARDSPRAIEVILPSGVAVLGIHPVAPFPEADTEARRFQFEFAALWALGREGPRVIAGDFNATPWSYPFRRLSATTGLRNSQRGYGLELTFPAASHPVFQISIDHLLHSPDLAVIDRRLGPPLGSDHLPVLVELAMIEGS
ncbi:MAG TPA: endonuclease/exonuclease/phosphatase family protein [Acidimicrobiia bacterium]|nr:endonuclease/exonuclease/phosphatase family protein [Acidimicrobiia bacterium]